ncbi:MAG TPA: methyltransferase domain-containing protein [Candidatus Baltobacteraceae bacterium]
MRCEGATELIDRPIDSISELAGSLRDIERANRYLGGARPVIDAIARLGPSRVLDVGCGSADIPRALVKAARTAGRPIEITCLDRSEAMLAIARDWCHADRGLRFVCAQGESLPFADGSFDVTMCNLALHHFEPAPAVALLRELRRVARVTPLVCDLRRSAVGFAGAWIFGNLTTRNRLTRHDAPLSVRRAYTPDEALSLAREAGWQAPVAERRPFFRMLLYDAR